MTVAQGQLKKLSYKKQTGLGSAASGSGGQYLRRETASFNKKKDTFNSNEITTHQQYTGDTYGVSKTEGSLDNVLSVGTYKDFMGSVVRKDFAAISAITSLSLTIAGSAGGPFTITRGTGSWLTDGVKIGHVGRITAGTYTGVARDINVLVTGVTATVITCIVPNGKDLAAQGPVASSTFTVIGKTTLAPTSGHTNDYYTFEEWYSDLSKSRLYTDVQVGSCEIAIPATGNSTIKLGFMGLGRTKGASQVLTSPTAETTTSILSASNGCILLAGSKVVTGTSMNLKIENGLAYGEAVIGSRVITDLVKGEIKASGTVTAVHDAETTSDYFENETAISVIGVLFADSSDTSDFTAFTMSRAKLFSDDIDDGKKQLVASYSFTAEINSAGGSALANDQTTIGIQDSQS
jgi:hypothetical protein